MNVEVERPPLPDLKKSKNEITSSVTNYDFIKKMLISSLVCVVCLICGDKTKHVRLGVCMGGGD